MHRRAFALPGLLMVAVLALGACGGSTTALSDPTEILTKAVETLQKAKSLHLDATVEGTLKIDMTGTGSASDIALTGTKLGADVDIEHGNVSLDLAVPAMLGMTAQVIVIGADSYTKTSFTGEKFQKSKTSDSGIPVDTTDPAKSLKDLQDWLKKPEVSPKKLGDASCGSKSCYQVEIDLSADELKSLAPDLGIGDGSVVLTILVEKDSLRPTGINVKISGTTVGEVTVKLSASKWDESLNITAPPADQVQ